MKLDISNLVCILNVRSTDIKVVQYGGHSGSRDLLNFWEISAVITRNDTRDIVTMED